MKRSAVNEIIRDGDAFIRSFGFVLPPFAYWSPAEMSDRRPEIGGIVGARLGWDITDYGQGNSTSSACSCSPCATAGGGPAGAAAACSMPRRS